MVQVEINELRANVDFFQVRGSVRFGDLLDIFSSLPSRLRTSSPCSKPLAKVPNFRIARVRASARGISTVSRQVRGGDGGGWSRARVLVEWSMEVVGASPGSLTAPKHSPSLFPTRQGMAGWNGLWGCIMARMARSRRTVPLVLSRSKYENVSEPRSMAPDLDVTIELLKCAGKDVQSATASIAA